MEHEEDVKELASTLEKHRRQMMTKLGEGASGSVDSLIHIIGVLGDTNQDVVRILLKSKHEISQSRELRELLLDYFSCSHKTLDFLNTLHAWLHGTTGISWRLNRLKTALKEFKSDKTKTGFGRTLLQRALNDFLKTKDPLVADQLRARLCVVLHEQRRLYERLEAKKDEVHRKDMMRCLVYRRVTTVVLASVYMGLFVCAIVTAVLSPTTAGPTMEAIAAIAGMNPVDYITKCMNRVLGMYEDKIKRRTELVNALMETETQMTLHDLDGIQRVVNALQDKIQKFSVNFGSVVSLHKDSVVKELIKDMETKIDEFAKAVKILESRKDKCYKDVMNARAKIFATTFGK